jgi:hypothetical protein
MTVINAVQTQKPSVTKADDLLFPVELVPVGAIFDDGNFAKSNSYQAVVRTDTNEVLGIHGKGYNLYCRTLKHSMRLMKPCMKANSIFTG